MDIFPRKISTLFIALREWRLLRSLLGLARKNSFSDIDPEIVSRTLQRLTNSTFLQDTNENLRVNTRTHAEVRSREFHLILCRQSLLKIWELAEQQLKSERELKFKWNRVMATCNALYEKMCSTSHAEREQVVHR